jgi:hypothetical protein
LNSVYGLGTGLVDFDHDGYPEAGMITGSVYPDVEKKLTQFPYKTPPVLFRNLGDGTFEELSLQAELGVSEAHSGRGCAFGDFDHDDHDDHDGDRDVLMVNTNEPPSLLPSDVDSKQRWLKIMREGMKSNRGAIGARVLVGYGGKTQAQAALRGVQLLLRQRSSIASWPGGQQ